MTVSGRFGSSESRGMVVVAILAAFALIAAACDTGGEATTTSVAITPTTTGATTPTTTPEVEGFTYSIGMTFDLMESNFWATMDHGTLYQWQVFGPTKPYLFTISYPAVVTAPMVATGLPVEAVQEGDVWTATQPIRNNYTWSDGSLLTADDLVFTFEAARDVGLGGLWLTVFPYTEESPVRLLSVEAVDDFTVKFTFDSKPGSAVWPHTAGRAPIMSRVVWEPLVEQALQVEDPIERAKVLLESDASEVGDLSGGAVRFNAREVGAFAENVANDNYALSGLTEYTWDDGSYAQEDELLYGEGAGEPSVVSTEGPFLDRQLFLIYPDQTSAMLALTTGEIDLWANPVGLSPGLRELGQEADNLEMVVNPSNGFRYLAFNLRQSPGKFHGFRQAMAYMVDKEFLTQDILQGVAFPMYAMVPEGNRAWYDTERADAIAAKYVGLSTQERINKAYEALEGEGFTWATPPERDDEGNVVTPGIGIIDPEGVAVPEVEILAPSASYDPLRAAAALWVEDWAEQLGVTAKANPTDINTIIPKVWPGVGQSPAFDMYILAWTLGNAEWPRFHESFFHSKNTVEMNNGANSVGYINPEMDALADSMYTLTDQAQAFDNIWKMEEMVARDLPYVVMFDTPLVEFYNKDLIYPYTATIGGLVGRGGMPGAVLK